MSSCSPLCLRVSKCFDELLSVAEDKQGVINPLISHLCLHISRHGAADVIKLVPGIVQSLTFGPTRTKTHR